MLKAFTDKVRAPAFGLSNTCTRPVTESVPYNVPPTEGTPMDVVVALYVREVPVAVIVSGACPIEPLAVVVLTEWLPPPLPSRTLNPLTDSVRAPALGLSNTWARLVTESVANTVP